MAASVTNPTAFSISSPGDYRINNMYYPEGISTDPSMPHYLTFFINVNGKSQLLTNNTVTALGNAPGYSNLTSPEAAANVVKSGATVAGTLIGGKLGSKFTKLPGGAIAGTVVGGAAGGALGAAAASSITANAFQRITDCITLHISNPPSVSYSMDYEQGELDTVLGIISQAGGIEHMANMANKETYHAALQSLVNTFGTKNFKSSVQMATNQVLNPFKAMLFKSVSFRVFKFDYVFMPKNQNETLAVKNIIQTFKMHMHPELSENSFFFLSPSEFNIVYYYKGAQNVFVNSIANCALSDMDVTYGGQTFNTFEDGSPTEIHMTLTFKETSPVTREQIQYNAF